MFFNSFFSKLINTINNQIKLKNIKLQCHFHASQKILVRGNNENIDDNININISDDI